MVVELSQNQLGSWCKNKWTRFTLSFPKDLFRLILTDKMEEEELGQWLGSNLESLRRELLTGDYPVSAVRKVEIPKPNGGVRTLGIPTVKDRLVQQAIHQQLNRFYEPHFSDHSYGFRPNRDAHQAILQASEYIRAGKEWVVDIDLEKFFDKINHDRLIQRLKVQRTENILILFNTKYFGALHLR
jgi:RNA-directed DNA polymerase